MDDGFLEKMNALAAAGRAHDLEFAAVVARVAVDRFLAIAEPDEVACARFATLMTSALDKTDEPAAIRIAEMLAPHPATPTPVLQALVGKGPACAAIVLERTPRLPREMLRWLADRVDADLAVGLAGRDDLDAAAVAALSRRPEADVLQALVANPHAALDGGALALLMRRGRTDQRLAHALLQRGPVSSSALPLFLFADATTRRALMLEAQRDSLSAGPLETPLSAARARLLELATTADRNGFARETARVLKVGRADVVALIDDPGGDTLGLLLAAIGAPTERNREAVIALRPDLVDLAGALRPGVRLALAASVAAAFRIVGALVNIKSWTSGSDGSLSRSAPAIQHIQKEKPQAQAIRRG